MLLKIRHETKYLHASSVSYGLMELRMMPRQHAIQNVVGWTVTLNGAEEQLRFTDQHRNEVILAAHHGESREITVACEGEVETRDTAGVVGEHAGFAPLWYYKRQTPLTQPASRGRALLREAGSDHETDVTQLHALSALILNAVSYETGVTSSETTAEEALEVGKGVCQDHTHILIGLARELGFPARYVSGYLMMNDRVDQEAGHAWAEVYFNGLGWVGFDVSNGISSDARYVRVAVGLDYREAAPVTGLHHGKGDRGNDKMLVNIQVQQ
ncbi:transglutaminase family protein [Salaquimonas pukyongi]|uniref:transglutaminase family protein n=1 Tax=Salaquimonas pukyongi TaxID=2712698 RepID=UPI00096BCDA0|nr:transglutaminase family protein [Salaquimonas pukyongi]